MFIFICCLNVFLEKRESDLLVDMKVSWNNLAQHDIPYNISNYSYVYCIDGPLFIIIISSRVYFICCLNVVGCTYIVLLAVVRPIF